MVFANPCQPLPLYICLFSVLYPKYLFFSYLYSKDIRGMSTQLFQQGVQNWMLRSKHGRDRIFATPTDMWNAAVEYFKSVDDNPWYKLEVSKGGESAGDIYEIPTV